MSTNRHPKSNLKRNRLLLAAGWMALAMPALLGQAPSTASLSASVPYVATMTFDVASVRENKAADLHAGITMGGWFTPNTTDVRLINWNIENLISAAYGSYFYQLAGLPNWPMPTVFMVEAKGNGDEDAKMGTLTREQQHAEQQHMLQSLLKDRFKLKAHWETKEGDVYNLVVAKGGSKLASSGSTPPSDQELKMFGEHPIPPLYQKNDGQGYDFIAHGCTIADLVTDLTSQFGRPVIDKTGLAGKYDFVLRYKGRWDRDRPGDDMDTLPPLDRALQDELGLKIEAGKGPDKMLVIDHVEKPSEN